MTAVGNAEVLASSLGGFLDRPIGIVDAGARWGPASAWDVLRSFSKMVAFEPDAGECQRLREQYSLANMEFVASALGSTRARRILHVTKEPACSSFYAPDKSVLRHRPDLAIATEVGTEETETVSLDDWLAENDFGAVDFIKLDTQGAELDILMGAEQALSSVRIVEVEVFFNEIYEGQPLFGDVDRFLREQGFVLWRISDLAHYSSDAGEHFQRAEAHFFDSKATSFLGADGQLTWGNAFYVARSLAFPGPTQNMHARLRDIMLAATLNFWGLASRTASFLRDEDPRLVKAVEVSLGPNVWTQMGDGDLT